jgi:radical SAM protein with 4Fe4S-binding SPASM domain
MNKSICAYPWAAAAVRPNGTIIPCCKFDHNDEYGNVNDLDPRNSQQWIELRSKMLEGQLVKNCQSCYNDERNGIESLRQQISIV